MTLLTDEDRARMMLEEVIPVDPFDEELLDGVSVYLLDSYDVPNEMRDGSIYVEGIDGFSCLVNPKEEDGRRWVIKFFDDEGEHLGTFETTLLDVTELPGFDAIAESVAAILHRLHSVIVSTT